jgi:hypothetical protein
MLEIMTDKRKLSFMCAPLAISAEVAYFSPIEPPFRTRSATSIAHFSDERAGNFARRRPPAIRRWRDSPTDRRSPFRPVFDVESLFRRRY